MIEPTWSNWFGNQTCHPKRILSPSSEAEVQEIVEAAKRDGLTVRVVGSGHSLPPVVNTDGVLIDLRNLSGNLRVDSEARTMTAAAGTKLSALFDPLWDAGFAMKNMGELADSTLAGAIGTGAHGTGHALQCTSAEVKAMRLVTANDGILEISEEENSAFLKAAQVSVGMLGVVTEVTLEVMPAYDLEERQTMMSVDEIVAEWDALFTGYRHFSFFYFATEAAGASFATALPHLPPSVADACFATMIDARDPSEPARAASGTEHVRRDRMNRVLTVEFDPNYREIEYAVPLDVGMQTFLDLRDMLRKDHPDYTFPVNVRILAGDDAYLSAYNGGAKYVFSVSDDLSAPWDGVLSKAEALFQERGGLPHWGKEHALTRQSARALFKDFDRFQEVRQRLDPEGVFLNAHLRDIFG